MRQIPMLDLQAEYRYMKGDVDAALQRCLDHQRWIFGPEVKEFEDMVRDYLGTGHCVGASSGTEALVLSLRALAIKERGEEYFGRSDEIITTSFTFTATGDAILRAGATPVFVDIDPATYNIDISQVRAYLSSRAAGDGSRVVGIIPVHLYGRPCDMDAIMEIAKEYGLFVVEDVAQSFGAKWREKKLGAIGHCGAFSFFPSKNLGGFGDAGMVATSDSGIAEIVRMLVKHGGKDKYNVDHVGYNARLDTLQAAVLKAKMGYIDEFNDKRRAVAARYGSELAGIEGLVLPDIHPGEEDEMRQVFHQYTVRTPRRDDLQRFLQEGGISTMVYYPFPLHRMRVFNGRMKAHGDLLHSERASAEVLSLPIEPLQADEDTAFVADSVKRFFHSKE